jgi:hypothetical protein
LQTVGGGNDGRPLSPSVPAVARLSRHCALSSPALGFGLGCFLIFFASASCFPCVPFSSPGSQSRPTMTATGVVGIARAWQQESPGQFFQMKKFKTGEISSCAIACETMIPSPEFSSTKGLGWILDSLIHYTRYCCS